MSEALPIFRYRALTAAGDRVSGELAAKDRAAAIARLQAQGLVPLAAEAATGNRVKSLLRSDLFGGERLSPRQLADFTQQLAILIGAGIPAEQALGTLAGNDGAPSARRVSRALLQRLRSGASLAEAMSAQPKIFPPIALGMVRAGESSGALDGVLARLADYLRRSAEIGETIRSALIYPAILLATAFGSVLLILIVVLPKLRPLITHAKTPLPLATRMMFVASDVMRDWWWLLAIGAAALGAIAWQTLQDPSVRRRCDRLFLHLPMVGAAIQRAETARFARTLGALAGANVALPAALGLAQAVLANKIMADGVDRARKRLKEGEGLADPLAATGLFPDLAIQFIRIGEATGRLDEMLLKQADLFEGEVRRLIDRGLTLLVPAITILMGLVVGGVIAAVMSAILTVNNVTL